jgi:hypothetical protein
VAGRILAIVRFDLDDHAADPVHQQAGADEVGSDVVDAAREELAPQRLRRA